MAARFGWTDIVMLLLEHGGLPTIEDGSQYLPWMRAAVSGYGELKEILYKRVFETAENKKEAIGSTSKASDLDKLTTSPDQKHVTLDLNPGYESSNTYGNRPDLIGFNQMRNRPSMPSVPKLDQHSHQAGRALLNALASKETAVCRALLEKGTNPDLYLDENKRTALHVACQTEDAINIVDLVLEFGANTNVVDKSGYRPLHYACIEGLDVYIELLSHAGANLEVRNNEMATALHVTALEYSKNTMPIVETLLEEHSRKYGPLTKHHLQIENQGTESDYPTNEWKPVWMRRDDCKYLN